ncbi:MAG: DNA (cytosine-5-)-methyltransferase [Oscillospiraceae bacterium]|jgi:DNA (cytosine-5)-methyltransferase 1|nr:DNA (cytosine-5-)-methyltransferase [Oscillospiraceae bacterium]
MAGKSKSPGPFTFIDLFAGIGGLRLAFEASGCVCVFSSEWDRFAQKTYAANFGEPPFGDITKILGRDIPDHDILAAGFPCQPFSIAGVSKKNSLGRATGFLDKAQGTLFFEVVRIISDKRPPAFLLENVKNLKSHDGKNTFRVITGALDELGYGVFHAVLDAGDYLPQHRERIFIAGFDKKRFGEDIPFGFELEKPASPPRLGDILESAADDRYTLSDRLWRYLQSHARKHRAKGNGFGYGLADINGASRTLSARYYKDGSEILIPQEGKNPRRLTPRECGRLMGFPESFIIPVSDTQAYRQFGNSVAVPLAAAVAKRLTATLSDLWLQGR